MQGELALKNVELATASREAEKLLKDISENTAIAEVEKGKVAVIVEQVSTTAVVCLLPQSIGHGEGDPFRKSIRCPSFLPVLHKHKEIKALAICDIKESP